MQSCSSEIPDRFDAPVELSIEASKIPSLRNPRPFFFTTFVLRYGSKPLFAKDEVSEFYIVSDHQVDDCSQAEEKKF